MHAKDFDNALLERKKALTWFIQEGNQFLPDYPPGAIGPPLTRNNSFSSLGEFGTSRGHNPRDPPKYCPPLTLPAEVLPPPKRKASDQAQRKKPPPPARVPQIGQFKRSATCSGHLPAACWPPFPPPPPAPPCSDQPQVPHTARKQNEPATPPPPPPASQPPDPKQPPIHKFFLRHQ